MHIYKIVHSTSNNQIIYVRTIQPSLVPTHDTSPVRVKFFIPLNSRIFNTFSQHGSIRIWQQGNQGLKKYFAKLFEDTREIMCTKTSKIVFSITWNKTVSFKDIAWGSNITITIYWWSSQDKFCSQSVNLPSIWPSMTPMIGEIHVGHLSCTVSL